MASNMMGSRMHWGMQSSTRGAARGTTANKRVVTMMAAKGACAALRRRA